MKTIKATAAFTFDLLNCMHGNEVIISIKCGVLDIRLHMNPEQTASLAKILTGTEFSPDNKMTLPISVRAFSLVSDPPRKYVELKESDLKKPD